MQFILQVCFQYHNLDTSSTFTDDSFLYSNSEIFSNLEGNTEFSQEVKLPCSVGGVLGITYTTSNSPSGTLPSWVSIDSTTGDLSGTTPIVKSETTYVFDISSSSIAWTEKYLKQVTLTIKKCVCKVDN